MLSVTSTWPTKELTHSSCFVDVMRSHESCVHHARDLSALVTLEWVQELCFCLEPLCCSDATAHRTFGKLPQEGATHDWWDVPFIFGWAQHQLYSYWHHHQFRHCVCWQRCPPRLSPPTKGAPSFRKHRFDFLLLQHRRLGLPRVFNEALPVHIAEQFLSLVSGGFSYWNSSQTPVAAMVFTKL